MNENDDKDIQALRANIVATRERLAAEVGEVGDRLTPEHAKEVAKEKMLEAKDRAIESTKEATEQVAASAASAGRTLADTVRENPIPSAMVAVGAVAVVATIVVVDVARKKTTASSRSWSTSTASPRP